MSIQGFPQCFIQEAGHAVLLNKTLTFRGKKQRGCFTQQILQYVFMSVVLFVHNLLTMNQSGDEIQNLGGTTLAKQLPVRNPGI